MGIGTILALFHSLGKVPLVKDKLKSLVRLGAILYAHDFNILAEMLSTPVDFDESRLTSISATLSSMQRNSSGNSCSSVLGRSRMDNALHSVVDIDG